MEAVLGLSVTSSSVGWVLLDGPGVDAAALDHDVFDVAASFGDDPDISRHIAAVRGVLSIAAASGHELKSIGLTWTPDAAPTASMLLTALPDLGLDDVASVRLSEAARTWAYVYRGALGFEKAAVCVLEPAAATLLSFGYGAVRTFAIHTRESEDGLNRWLNDAFDTNNLDPQHLFLIGSRADIELMSGRLADALPMPVVTSDEAQLVLARGAALAARASARTTSIPLAYQQIVVPKQTLIQKLPWLTPPARVAAALLAGVVALMFIVGPELLGPLESAATEIQATKDQSTSSTTSVSIQAVPAPVAAPPPRKVIQRLVQAPPPLEVSAREAPVTAEPLALPQTPVAAEVPVAVAAEAPAAVLPAVPEATGPDIPAAAEPVEVAHLPEPVETPHLSADTELPGGTAHLPDAATASHLPGATPALAAEAPLPAPAPTPVAPQAPSSSVWAALP